MDKWFGSAGVCVKDDCVLMVLQGTVDEPKRWSIPSGGVESGETFEACCIREVKEETGYNVEIVRFLFKKKSDESEVYYFEVNTTGGRPTIQDPDKLIYDIDWKSLEEIQNLSLSYEVDREYLIDFIRGIKK